MSKRTAVFTLLAVVVFCSRVWAQGVILPPDDRHPWPLPRPVPEPQPTSYQIKELGVDVTLNDQVAQVQVTQSFVNTGDRQMEVVFIYPLPHDAAVTGLTFMVEDEEFEAEVLDRDEARAIYESYMRKNLDPALMEWMGWGLFKTSVFPVPAGAERTVTLRYSQICNRQNGLTELLFPLSTAKFTSAAVEQVRYRVAIQSQAPIRNVYSPTHEVDIERPSSQQAIVEFAATESIPTGDFRLFYDVGNNAVATTVLSYRPDENEDGYFAVLANYNFPLNTDDATLSKSVVLAVDRSGSMDGEKMEQARGALRYVIENLALGDRFNIITYDSRIESFRPELQTLTDETREQALGFINSIYAGGSTNIDGALEAALSQLDEDSSRNYVIFLTDGRPTHGERTEPQIVLNASEHNQVRARLFCFGVGYDVNSRLLTRLARENFGRCDYVRPEEDIATQVSTLYDRLNLPVMSDVVFNFDLEGASVADGEAANRVYPRGVHDLFSGEQLVLVGRYRTSGAARGWVSGKLIQGETRTFEFPGQLVEHSNDETYAFVAKLWAVRRIGEIIDQIDLEGQNEELVEELVKLSIQHGIITPYTSYLADDKPEIGGPWPVEPPHILPMPLVRAMEESAGELDQLAENSEGAAGVELRDLNETFREADILPADGPAQFFSRNGAGSDQEGDALGRHEQTENVLNLGSKTFYLYGEQWIESSLTSEQIGEAILIEQFSEEYFALAATLDRSMARYLTIEGNVVLEINDQVYTLQSSVN